MNYEGARVCQRGVMFRPQPDLEISQRAVPAEYLDNEGKDKAQNVDDLYCLVSDTE